jgi:coenzyme F420-reducing hydrogenase beta subunit
MLQLCYITTGDSLEGKLTTIDLICHGTPSPKILDMFLKQYGEDIHMAESIDFRVKGNFQVSEHSHTIATRGVCDRYMISFLSALSYTENCYSCKYAQEKRPGDITLGDSWGTELSENEWHKGVSLVLCQTEKGKSLLELAKIKLVDVNIEKAKSHNHQLEHPSKAPKSRDRFVKYIKHGMKFNRAVLYALPKDSGKQLLKEILIRCKLLTPGGGRG